LHEGRGGAPLWTCWHGCDGREIGRELARRGLLGSTPQAPKPRALPKPKPPAETPRRVIEAEYVYRDETGRPAFMVRRYRPKAFSQHRPDGRGGWVPGIQGVRLLPYRLPELLQAEIAFVPEGEKDCEALFDFGFTATCNPMGAGKFGRLFRQHNWEPFFRGKICVVIPDADAAGARHAADVVATLTVVARSVVILRPPKPAKDAAEAFSLGLWSDAVIAEMVDEALVRLETNGGRHVIAA
jgi:hypothetical protein